MVSGRPTAISKVLVPASALDKMRSKKRLVEKRVGRGGPLFKISEVLPGYVLRHVILPDNREGVGFLSDALLTESGYLWHRPADGQGPNHNIFQVLDVHRAHLASLTTVELEKVISRLTR